MDAYRIRPYVECNMATVNKSERKQLVGTSVVRDSITVFARKDTGEEFARVDVTALTPEMQLQCMLYGVKQVVADCVSAAEGIDAKIAGMSAAVAAIGSGTWPRRTGAPVSTDKAVETLMKALGETREQVMARLGMVG